MSVQRSILYGLIAVVTAASAHHSTAMFDAGKRVSLDATVKQLQWTNPHAWLQLVVKNAQGESAEWSIEMGNPAAMIREGWKSNSLKSGDRVTVIVSPLKNGGNGGNLISVQRDDGSYIGKQGP